MWLVIRARRLTSKFFMVAVGAPAQPPKLQGHIMQIQFSEKELEDFLCQDNNLKKYLGLRFVARQVKIEPIGIIDILAFDWDSKSWVIIELKKDLLDSFALMQGLSYLNYYKYISNYKDYFTTFNCNHNFRQFKLLLIGQNLDSNLFKNTRHFQGNFDENWDIYYKLFGLQFDSGINFDFYSQDQDDIEGSLGVYLDKLLDCYNKQSQPIRYFGHLNERIKRWNKDL